MFANDSFIDDFIQRAAMRIRGGGAELGELAAIGAVADDGGVSAAVAACIQRSRALVEQATVSERSGHLVSARDCSLRASTYYDLASWWLYGAPVDDRLRDAATLSDDAFASAMRLSSHQATFFDVPGPDGCLMPAWLLRPAGITAANRTILHTNGYDSNVHEMYFAHAVAALDRGWNVVLFDGPGQGRNLVRDGIHIRPDWENVVAPMLDAMQSWPGIDPDRVVLSGWSFGGLLAPRAAGVLSDRLAAVVADPGQWDQREAVLAMAGLDEAARAAYPDVDLTPLHQAGDWIAGPEAPAMLRWKMIQRGYWVHGVESFADYVADLCRFTVSDVAAGITCPALIVRSESDPLSTNAQKLFEAVSSERKQIVDCWKSDGTVGHCESDNRSLYSQRVFDVLDEWVQN